MKKQYYIWYVKQIVSCYSIILCLTVFSTGLSHYVLCAVLEFPYYMTYSEAHWTISVFVSFDQWEVSLQCQPTAILHVLGSTQGG